MDEQWYKVSGPEAEAAVRAYREYGLEADLSVIGEGGSVPEQEYSALYLADSDRILQQLSDEGAALCAYSHSGNQGEKLGLSDYILMEPQWVDLDSLVKIWQRQRHLPWTILGTRRCEVREFVPEDLDAIYDLYDEEARRFLQAPSEDRERERQILASYIDRVYRLGGYGDWAVISKETGGLIGRMGFSFPSASNPGPTPDVTFGYLLHRDWRGKGIAREVCPAIIKYGFELLGFETIGADAAVSNVNSAKILKSLGFFAVAEKNEQRYYILNKKDWRNFS